MARPSLSGGVRRKGDDGIEFDFYYRKKRYRITVPRVPTEANLRRARVQMDGIKRRMASGTFSISEEFPDYRHAEPSTTDEPDTIQNRQREPPQDARPQVPVERTCDEVFDAFLAHCEMRVASNDMAFSTFNSYRKILKRSWRPKLGARAFKSVVYSELVRVAAAQRWRTKKTYNNGISPLRCAFEFGYKDHPERPNPAKGLDSLRITKIDRPKIDPFTVQEAEQLIRGIHTEWGEAIGNFDEFRFFTGLRQSEEISLRQEDCDLNKGTIQIRRVIVLGREKDRPKNNEARTVELCPRALQVLKRQLALRERYALAGKIKHPFVFFQESGQPIRSLKYPYTRWIFVVQKLAIRYREPYNARHSFVSWSLMIGKNPMWCSKQFAHGVQLMYERYGTWIEGATEADLAAIRQSLAADATGGTIAGESVPSAPFRSPELVADSSLENQWGRLSWRKVKYFNSLTGGADGTRIGRLRLRNQ